MLPQTTMYVSIAISVLALYSRLLILKPLIYISVNKFFKEVIFLVLIVAFLSMLLPLLIRILLLPGYLRLVFIFTVGVFSTSFSVFIFGLNRSEKLFVRKRIGLLTNNANHFKK